MDTLMKLSTGAKLTLGALVLYFIDGFLPWQKAGPFSINEWHGIGVLAALIGIALLVWEAMPLFMQRPPLKNLNPRLLSLVLAAALVLFTLIRVLSTYAGWHRAWGSWVGLILSVAVAAGIYMQAQAEGFKMPDLSAMRSGGGGSSTASSTPPAAPAAPTPPPAAPTPPPAPERPAGEPTSGGDEPAA
jgi:hypothetical protein